MQQQNQVKVSIVAQLSGEFKQAFSAADKQMQALGKTASDLNKKVGDIQAFRRQQNAVKDSGRAWQEARGKLAALKTEIGASEQASKKQLAQLKRAEDQVRRTGAAYTEQRTKLAQMNAELVKGGVNVAKLSTEYKRLQGEITKTTAKHTAMEKSLQRQQKIVKAMEGSWQKIGAGIAGMAAGAAVLSGPAAKGMNWEERVMRLADVAGSGKSVDQRKAIQQQLSDAITKAQKFGGGKRDDIAGGLDTLIGTGGMDPTEASAMLPAIAQAAFASNTEASQVAAIALKAKQFGVNDPTQALDIVMRGGQAGGVEMKHMAQFLPEQMASARAAGYSGAEGLAQLVSMNQLALRTAGDPTTAANNVQNLLNKLIAPEFAKNVKDVTGKDWAEYSLKQREKGVYGAEAFAQLADESMGGNQQYQDLKKRLAASKDKGERAGLMNDMAAMMEGSQMGQYIQDRQALSAGLAMMYSRKDVGEDGKSATQSMLEKVRNSQGAVASSSDYLRTGTFSKATDASEAVNRANESTFAQLSEPMGKLLSATTGLADQFPGLATAAYGAAAALTAIAAGGFVNGIFKGGGAAGGAAGVGSVLKGATGKVPLVGALAAGGIDAYQTANDATLTDAQKKAQYTGAAVGTVGALGGAKLGAMGGAAIGAFGGPLAPLTVPLGAAVGGVAGGVAGWYGGQAAGDWAGGKMFGGSDDAAKAAADSAKAASEAATAAQNRPNLTVNTTNQVTVQAPAGAGAAELGALLNKQMLDLQRKQNAEIRGRMIDPVGN